MNVSFVRAAVVVCSLLVGGHASAGQNDGLTTGDKLRITVLGQNDLSGEVTVEPKGTIFLPVLGQIQVKEKSLPQLEAKLLNSYSVALRRPVSVRVDLVERSPFYVLGAVNSPGSYPYKPGIAVLHAVATAGGLESMLKSNPSMVIEGTREQARFSSEVEHLKRSLAEYARLTAERDGVDRAVAPSQLVELAGQGGAADLMTRENEILQQQTKKIQQQTAAFESLAFFAKEELAAYQQQLEQLSKKEAVIQTELDSDKGLREQGLITRVRIFDLERALPEMNAERSAVLAAIARTQQEIVTAARRANDLRQSRKLEVEQRLVAVGQDIEQTRSAVHGSSQIAQFASDRALPSTSAAAHPRYEIVRQSDDGFVTIPADELTPVMPGDVVRVKVDPGSLASRLDRDDARNVAE